MTRKLDALVAERVMEWVRWTDQHNFHMKESVLVRPDQDWSFYGTWVRDKNNLPFSDRLSVPNYSSDIAAAWEVADKFEYVDLQKHDGRYYAYLSNYFLENEHVDGDHTSDSMPLSIAVAALRAVGVSEDEIKQAMEVGT